MKLNKNDYILKITSSIPYEYSEKMFANGHKFFQIDDYDFLCESFMYDLIGFDQTNSTIVFELNDNELIVHEIHSTKFINHNFAHRMMQNYCESYGEPYEEGIMEAGDYHIATYKLINSSLPKDICNKIGDSFGIAHNLARLISSFKYDYDCDDNKDIKEIHKLMEKLDYETDVPDVYAVSHPCPNSYDDEWFNLTKKGDQIVKDMFIGFGFNCDKVTAIPENSDNIHCICELRGYCANGDVISCPTLFYDVACDCYSWPWLDVKDGKFIITDSTKIHYIK